MPSIFRTHTKPIFSDVVTVRRSSGHRVTIPSATGKAWNIQARELIRIEVYPDLKERQKTYDKPLFITNVSVIRHDFHNRFGTPCSAFWFCIPDSVCKANGIVDGALIRLEIYLLREEKKTQLRNVADNEGERQVTEAPKVPTELVA